MPQVFTGPIILVVVYRIAIVEMEEGSDKFQLINLDRIRGWFDWSGKRHLNGTLRVSMWEDGNGPNAEVY